MKFIVLGAGAIGSYVGARLAAAGQTVVLVTRPRHRAAWQREGLEVSDLDGFHARLPPAKLNLAPDLAGAWAKANAMPSLGASPNTCVVLLCVKGGATTLAAEEIAQVCPAGTAVVSLQNGVDNPARIKAAAPAMHTLAGMVPYNVVMKNDHAVHRASAGSIFLAHDAVTLALAPIMKDAGLPVVLSADMRAVQWGKLLLNLNNPVNALSDLPLKTQLLDKDLRWVFAALQSEALAVMARAGIRPARVTSAPPWLLPHILRLPDGLFRRVASRMLSMDASARSSMWDDVQQDRITEIDDLCGAVVRLAMQQGVQAPRNAAVQALVSRHAKGTRWSGAALRQHISHLSG